VEGRDQKKKFFSASRWTGASTFKFVPAPCTGHKLELCADELVVGAGVGWSYDRRRRRAAHFSSAAAAAWLYGRRRRRRRRPTGWQSTETAHSLDMRFFLVYRDQPLHLWSLLGRWRRKVNCEYACCAYACCAQFYSRNEFLEAHIYAMLSVEGTLM